MCPRGASATLEHVHNSRARSQRGESRAPVSRATLAGAAPRAARVGSAGSGGPRRADFITPIPAPSRRKPGAWPTRYVRGPHCPISESRRGFSSPLQRKPRVRPTRNVRGWTQDEPTPTPRKHRDTRETRPQTNTKCPISQLGALSSASRRAVRPVSAGMRVPPVLAGSTGGTGGSQSRKFIGPQSAGAAHAAIIT